MKCSFSAEKLLEKSLIEANKIKWLTIELLTDIGFNGQEINLLALMI